MKRIRDPPRQYKSPLLSPRPQVEVYMIKEHLTVNIRHLERVKSGHRDMLDRESSCNNREIYKHKEPRNRIQEFDIEIG